jgi:3',5'-cyclic AMP phosphodiesterase CpdA
MIIPGDNLYQGTDYNIPWTHWMSKGFTFDVVAIGNHTAGYDEEVEFFGMPGEYYTRVMDGTRFLVLNSDNVRTAGEQARWLDRELSQANESRIFVVLHHPPLTLTSSHPWEERRAFHQAVRPLLFRHRDKLTAVIAGHDHMASLASFDGLPVVVSGAAHEARRPEVRNDVQEGIRVRTEWIFDRTPYWVRLDLDSNDQDGKSTVRFIRARDSRETCTVVIRTGSVSELGDNCAQ